MSQDHTQSGPVIPDEALTDHEIKTGLQAGALDPRQLSQARKALSFRTDANDHASARMSLACFTSFINHNKLRLTPQQTITLLFLLAGLPNRSIARAMDDLSVETVKDHIKAILLEFRFKIVNHWPSMKLEIIAMYLAFLIQELTRFRSQTGNT